MHIKVVACDVDNCIAPTEEVAQRVGRKIVLGSLLPSKGVSGVEIAQDKYTADCAGHTFSMTLRRFAREYRFELSPQEEEAYVLQEKEGVIAEMHRAGLELAPNFREVLDFLSSTGREIRFASSSTQPRLKATFELTGLGDRYAAGHVISAESDFNPPRPKPDPECYYELLRRLGVPASNAIAVEDSTSGFKAAHQVMRAAVYLGLVPQRDRPEAIRKTQEAGATLYFDNWGLFPQLVERLEQGRVDQAMREFRAENIKTNNND